MQTTVLTIAGSDSSGGAGIQADLKAIAANGGYGASVITAITAQNTVGVTAAETVSPALLTAQLDAVFDDLQIAAVKTGMLADAGTIEIVAEALEVRRPPALVCDPVMISKSGHPLLPPDCADLLARRLLPLADLVTPNVAEVTALTGLEPRDAAEAEEAGRRLLRLGARAVLVKGGHLAGDPATDVLVQPTGSRRFPGTMHQTRHTHGTGCTYSAAIATWLARGVDLVEAVGRSKRFIDHAIRHGLEVGRGHGPTDPFFFMRSNEEGEAWLADVRP